MAITTLKNSRSPAQAMLADVFARDAAQIRQRVNLDKLEGKTILITGASGLLGTYFLATLAHLKEGGVPVKVVAQVRSKPAPHTEEIIQRCGFQLAQVDVSSHAECSSLPQADVIIHSAGYAQPLVFMANPVDTYEINTTATITLLRKLKPGGSFLFISSTEVYNGITNKLATEADIGTTDPSHPRACYIEGKRGGETICRAFRNQGVHATSARLAMTYGPGIRKGDKRAMNSFIEKALCQKRIELMDAGKAIRTYGYVSDAIELMWQAALHGTQPVYNIGGHSTVTIAELAELIGKIIGVPVSFPAQSGEVAGAPEEVRLDLTRAESEFHKQDYVSLEDGVRATIDWQRGLYAR
jgi:UDP-glucuronate decarboxylase